MLARNNVRVRIGGDSRDFNRMLRDTKRGLRGWGQSLSQLGAGISVGGFAMMARRAMDYADSIDAASQQTGIAIDRIQGLKFAVEQNKGSFEGLNNGLSIFRRQIADAERGTGPAFDALQKLGVSTKNADGSFRDLYAILADVSDGIKGTATEIERARIIQDLFGRGGRDLEVILSKGAAGLREYQAAAEGAGLVLDDVTTKALSDAKDELGKFGASVTIWTAKALGGIVQLAEAVGDAAGVSRDEIAKLREEMDKFDRQQSGQLPAGEDSRAERIARRHMETQSRSIFDIFGVTATREWTAAQAEQERLITRRQRIEEIGYTAAEKAAMAEKERAKEEQNALQLQTEAVEERERLAERQREIEENRLRNQQRFNDLSRQIVTERIQQQRQAIAEQRRQTAEALAQLTGVRDYEGSFLRLARDPGARRARRRQLREDRGFVDDLGRLLEGDAGVRFGARGMQRLAQIDRLRAQDARLERADAIRAGQLGAIEARINKEEWAPMIKEWHEIKTLLQTRLPGDEV